MVEPFSSVLVKHTVPIPATVVFYLTELKKHIPMLADPISLSQASQMVLTFVFCEIMGPHPPFCCGQS